MLYHQVFLIIFIQFYYLIFSPFLFEKSNKKFLKSDCYFSISYPKQYLLLSHNYPNGPRYLYVLINFEIYYFSHSPTSEKLQTVHHFFRIQYKCNGTLIYTTKGRNFTVMNLRVIIYLSFDRNISDNSKFADISFSFGPEFYFGYYQLLDMNVNFGIWVHVLNFGLNHIEISNDNINNTLYYLRRLSWIEPNICIVTENNFNVVIHPHYSNIPDGPIINIIARYIKDGIMVDYVEFTAFGCRSHVENPHQSIFFINEEFLRAELNFFVRFIKFNNAGWTFEYISFILNNLKTVDVNQSLYIPPYFKKVFLMNCLGETEYDSLGNEKTQYISENGTIFYTKQLRDIEISTGVKCKQWFSPLGSVASSA